MILENKKENEILSTVQGDKMTVDTEDIQYLFDLLSTNLYSDIYGSIVREYTSNAWDSHIEAGINDAIIVGFDTDKDLGSYFFVKDFGVGLSEDRVDSIFKKWGKSTKRESNNQIGAFGLGSKSALAYTDSFYIENRYNGKQTLYMMSKGETGTMFSELYSKNTDERNGVTIKIFLKNYYDKNNFSDAIADQLPFFENVYFQDCLTNDYKIYQADKFAYSELVHGEMRILLGKVTYPIDWKLLGLNRINCPIAVKFNIGELPIVPSRENIKYTPSAKELIKERIKEVAEELSKKYNEKIVELDDINEYFRSRNGYHYFKFEDKSINIDWVEGSYFALNKPVFKPLSNLNLDNVSNQNLFQRISPVGKITNSILRKGSDFNFRGLYNNEKIILRIDDLDKINSKTTKYIQSLYPNRQIFIVKQKNTNAYLFPKSNFFGNDNLCLHFMLTLNKVSKFNWRASIKQFQEWEDSVYNSLPLYESFIPTKEFLDSQKKIKQQSINYHELRKNENKILIKKGRLSERGSGIVYDNYDIKINELGKEKKIVVYGQNSDKDKLNKIYFIKSNRNKIDIVLTNRVNFTYLNLVPNYIHIDKFMEGKTEIFKRTVTSFILRDLQREYFDVFKNKDFIDKLSTHTANLMTECERYIDKYYPTKSGFSYGSFNYTDEFYQSLLEVARTNKLLDLEQLAVFNQLKPMLEKFKFIQYLKKNDSYGSKGCVSLDCLDFAVDFCKLNKIKLNSNLYIKKESYDKIINYYLSAPKEELEKIIKINDWKLVNYYNNKEYKDEIEEDIKEYLLSLNNEQIIELCKKIILEKNSQVEIQHSELLEVV